MRTALAALLLSLGSLVGCSSDDAPSPPSGESGAAGAAAGQGGSMSGSSGQSGAAGQTAGSGGQGLAGQSGSGGSGHGGAAGSAGAGASGAAGAGEGGAGMSGASGQSGDGGAGAQAGEGGAAGQGGEAGSGQAGGGQAGGGQAGGGQAGGGQAGGGQAGGGQAGGGSAGGTGEGGSAGAASGGLAEVLSAELFDEMFPNRGDPACQGSLFTHAALIEAAKAFPTFAAQGALDDRKRELAAFFANAGHETTGGWSTAPGGPQAWGLCFREELGCGGGACTGYCAASEQYPCAPGKTYHGRGPLQLSYNYNYGQAGDALGLPLLATPELVASDGVVSFRTALWFWMTAQAPKPSCHDVMTGQWSPTADDLVANRKPGFGMTINIINGGLECSQPTPDKVQDRLDYYARFTALLGVAPGDNLSCDTMKHY